MARVEGPYLMLAENRAARAKFAALDAAGAPVTGIASGSFTLRRSKNGEVPDVSITRTVTEIGAANMPGTYQITLDAADVDRPGFLEIRITAGGIEAVIWRAVVLPRLAFKDA
jgi:hypothetical protein